MIEQAVTPPGLAGVKTVRHLPIAAVVGNCWEGVELTAGKPAGRQRQQTGQCWLELGLSIGARQSVRGRKERRRRVADAVRSAHDRAVSETVAF
jgi:hypothetical protein